MQKATSYPFQLSQARYERGEATIEKLRRAFIDEVLAHGFYRANICEIARRVNLTRGAFYNYWSSLQECLADAILSCRKQTRASIPKTSVMKTKKPKGLHSSLIHKIREVFGLDIKQFRCAYLPLVLLHEKKFSDEDLSQLLRSSMEQIRTEWEDVLKKDQELKIIRSEVDTQAVAASLLNFVSGIAQNSTHDSEKEDLNRPLKNALDYFVFSLFTETYLDTRRHKGFSIFKQESWGA